MRTWKIVLWAFWIVLIAICVCTLVDLWLSGYHRFGVEFLLAVPCFAILCFAEGLELAVASSGGPSSVKPFDAHSFFTRRQALVILPITYISIVTVYPWVDVPGIGRLAGDVPFWFSLSLVSLTTLWFGQVVPKRMAVLHPELFLSAKITAAFMRLVDCMVVLDGPSGDVVRLLHRSRRRSSSKQCECAICVDTSQAWSLNSYRCGCSICAS